MAHTSKNRKWRSQMKHHKKEITKEEIKALIGKENPIILEIGCNDGTDTLEFLEFFPEASIYCFEPDPRAIKRFKRQVSHPKCHLYEGCISDCNGTITFNMSSGKAPRPGSKENDKSGSIKQPKNNIVRHKWILFEQQITVPTITLDTWYQNQNPGMIDFIWADTQGAEEEVIKGGLLTLTNHVRYFYTEYSNKEMYEGQITLGEIRKLLPCFSLLGLYANNALFRNKKLHG